MLTVHLVGGGKGTAAGTNEAKIIRHFPIEAIEDAASSHVVFYTEPYNYVLPGIMIIV